LNKKLDEWEVTHGRDVSHGDILLNRLALERRTVVVRRKVFGSERNLANGLITRETDRDE